MPQFTEDELRFMRDAVCVRAKDMDAIGSAEHFIGVGELIYKIERLLSHAVLARHWATRYPADP